jgi:hypothetical protein
MKQFVDKRFMQPSRRLQSVQTPVIPLIAELIRENPETISFGQGVVSYPPPESITPELNRFFLNPENNKYQSLSGTDSLKELIIEKLKVENNIIINKENRNSLMITAGGNQAFLNVALAILDPLTSMAKTDGTVLDELLSVIACTNETLSAVLDTIATTSGLLSGDHYGDEASESHPSPEYSSDDELQPNHVTCPECGAMIATSHHKGKGNASSRKKPREKPRH